jgi:hypothetical protein
MTKEEERKYKELGANFFRFILHAIILTNLIVLYQALYAKLDGYCLLYVTTLIFFIKRLYRVEIFRRQAYNHKMRVTEYMEYLDSKKKKN